MFSVRPMLELKPGQNITVAEGGNAVAPEGFFQGVGDALALSRFVASWRGHAQWANSFNLLNRLGVA